MSTTTTTAEIIADLAPKTDFFLSDNAINWALFLAPHDSAWDEWLASSSGHVFLSCWFHLLSQSIQEHALTPFRLGPVFFLFARLINRLEKNAARVNESPSRSEEKRGEAQLFHQDWTLSPNGGFRNDSRLENKYGTLIISYNDRTEWTERTGRTATRINI